MKALYSQIKELVPDLKATPKEVGEALTLTGFMMDGFTEVNYKGKKDYLLSLEIRQNRADCLSVIGLAREVAAYFNLGFSTPSVNTVSYEDGELDINIEAKDYVKRVLAIKINDLANGESPEWLKEYMTFYGLNSVSLLVDLSNYVMLLTGYPSHLIDCKKMNGNLSWSMNSSFDEITTLSNTVINLQKNSELIIRDEKNIIALAGIIGGIEAAIDMETKSIIAEVAVYDRSIIRKNSRSLSVVTEASHRLEKDLDSQSAEYAMNLLVSLISEYADGNPESALFDYYPNKFTPTAISFKTDLPGKFAGIEISKEDILKIFKNLNFIVSAEDDSLSVTPPSYRPDVSLPEDLVEEVLRVYGYNRIPSDEIPKLEIVRDITPKNIILAEKIRDTLSTLGFDEILSWPLTKAGDNQLVNYTDWNIVSTQNSVNDLYPDLRQSMLSGMLNQLDEYSKRNVEFINIFEIGKVFGEKNSEYLEHEALGIMSTSKEDSLTEHKNKTESLLRLIGIDDIKYFDAKSKPEIANPGSCWDIYAGDEMIGILYKLIPQPVKMNVYFSEININKATQLLAAVKNNPVVEIKQKLIALDVNIELTPDQSILEYLKKIQKKFDQSSLWSINVSDTYRMESKVRYTLRVTYKELSDQEAKKIHSEIFKI